MMVDGVKKKEEQNIHPKKIRKLIDAVIQASSSDRVGMAERSWSEGGSSAWFVPRDAPVSRVASALLDVVAMNDEGRENG